MSTASTFSEYAARLRQFVARAEVSPEGLADFKPDEQEFNSLAMELFTLQCEHNAVYRRFCAARGATTASVLHWSDIPTVPTSAFKEFELTSLLREDQTVVFHSSGTTGQQPSRHFHSAESLALYEASLLPWFKAHAVPDLAAAGHANKTGST